MFMLKQLSKSPANIPFCNQGRRGNPIIPGNISIEYEVDFTCDPDDEAFEQCETDRNVERVAWIWCIAFAFSLPQVGAFLKSVRKGSTE